MHPRRHAVLRAGPAAVALLSSLALAPAVAAHGHVEVGEYALTIGWINEPTFVGQPNGIEVFVATHDTAEPVTDLTAEALTVTVTTAEQDSPQLPLEPAFSLEGGFGTPGSYEAQLIPTTPGEYTVHILGDINGTAVDVSMTSGDDTFSSVRSASDIEFPVKNPTMADVATRLERIDGRVEQLQGVGRDVADLQAQLGEARAAADRAATAGILVGGAGVLLAAVALYLAWRAGRSGAGTA